MPEFTFIAFLKLIGALLASIGGATVVILGLAKWFGDFLSKQLLDNYKFKHERDLEQIKSKYSRELEETKLALEKVKSMFLRYSEKQFELYNDLWRVLLYTKNQADALWENATLEKIPSFSEQLKLTRDAINDNMLLIEEDHYTQLDQLVGEFEKFQFGKVRLIELRDLSSEEIVERGVNEHDIKSAITANKALKDQYDQLILKIGKSFRNQIKPH